MCFKVICLGLRSSWCGFYGFRSCWVGQECRGQWGQVSEGWVISSLWLRGFGQFCCFINGRAAEGSLVVYLVLSARLSHSHIVFVLEVHNILVNAQNMVLRDFPQL